MDDRKPSMVVIQESDEETVASQPEFPKGMAPKMLKLVKVLNDLESKVEPLISKQHHEVLSKLSPVERAKVGLMEVYTINSLFWVLMKTSGENIDATLREDYKLEMGRVKETQGKLAELEARAQRPPVDVRAAARFIHRSLGINQRRENEDVEMEQNYVSQGNGHTWNSYSHNEYQEGGDEEYENQDEEPQPVAFHKSTKKKKKVSPDQPACAYFSEGDNASSCQGSEDTSNTSQKTMKKKTKKRSSLHNSDNSIPEFSSADEVLINKKNNKKYETNGKLKKKKMKSESDGTVADMNGLQVANSDSGKVTSIKGKKKRKVEEELPDGGGQCSSGEDGEVTSAVSLKKMKKKAKEAKKVSQADIAAFIDTTRGRINYEFEENQDLKNKSRSWYEQGWT